MLLIGVGLTRTTPIHFGEEQAGRRLFRRWAKQADGTAIEVEVGSCSDGFDHFDPVVSGIEKTIRVGDSRWRMFPFKPFIDTIAAAIQRLPRSRTATIPTAFAAGTWCGVGLSWHSAN